MSTNVLQQVQKDMYARALATPYFDDIGLFLARPDAAGGLAAIQTQVDKALMGLTQRGGKCGIGCLFLMPTADAVDPNAPGPRLDFGFTVAVMERPLQNMGAGGTLKPAEEVALQVLSLYHHFKPNMTMCLTAAPRAMVPVMDNPQITHYDVNFTQKTGLEKPLKAAMPTADYGNLAAVALACATGGASLAYSLDGSYPTTTYSAPFAVTAGQLLRAVAGATDYQQSDVYEHQF